MKLLKALKTYSKLARVRANLASSSPVLIGYLVAKGLNLDPQSLSFILKVYLTFTLLLYGGIYTFNDIVDVESDKKHPVKSKSRAVASGEISIKNASMLCIGLISAGLVLGWFINRQFFFFEISFLLINLMYTFVLKEYAYLDIVGNSLTHPLRTIMGLTLAGGSLIIFRDLVITHILFEVAATTARRHRECQNGYVEARPLKTKYNITLLKNIQLTFFVAQLIHFYFTMFSPGFIMRMPLVLINAVAILLYRPKSVTKLVVDGFTYGKTDKEMVRELQDKFKNGEPISL